jgi:hypothetical protein
MMIKRSHIAIGLTSGSDNFLNWEIIGCWRVDFHLRVVMSFWKLVFIRVRFLVRLSGYATG